MSFEVKIEITEKSLKEFEVSAASEPKYNTLGRLESLATSNVKDDFSINVVEFIPLSQSIEAHFILEDMTLKGEVINLTYKYLGTCG